MEKISKGLFFGRGAYPVLGSMYTTLDGTKLDLDRELYLRKRRKEFGDHPEVLEDVSQDQELKIVKTWFLNNFDRNPKKLIKTVNRIYFSQSEFIQETFLDPLLNSKHPVEWLKQQLNSKMVDLISPKRKGKRRQ